MLENYTIHERFSIYSIFGVLITFILIIWYLPYQHTMLPEDTISDLFEIDIIYCTKICVQSYHHLPMNSCRA